MVWEPGAVTRAMNSGPKWASGYLYRGLGMVLISAARGRRPAEWWLIHLGSGHALCRIRGRVAVAFPIAKAIADCGDWEFDGLDGYKNRDPEIKKRAKTVMESFGKKVIRLNGDQSEEIARAVVMERVG